MARRHLHAVPEVGEGAVLYVRQSVTRYVRDDQGRKTKVLDTVSPELQETAGRDYCERKGYRVVDVVTDLNRTGRTLKRRKVQEAINYIDSGEASVIVVWKWSRMARNRRDWAVTCDYVEDKVGGRLESSTEPVDVTTAVGRLQRGMLVEIAAFESDRAGEVWKEVMDGRAAKGLPGHGRARFGYINIGKGRFEPHPELGEVLASMYRAYIGGDGYLTIARRLNDHGHRTTAGGMWREGNVRTVLDSGFGAGYFVHRGVLVRGVHTAVISEDEWRQYLTARDERVMIPPRAKSSRYLLTGLVKCGYCGGGMTARPDRNGVHWYRCRSRSLNRCPNPWTKLTDVEREVMSWLRNLVAEVDRATEANRKAQAKVTTHRNRAEVLERQIKQQNEALKRLTVDRARGLVPDDAYEAARDEIREARDRLQSEYSEAIERTRSNARVDVSQYRGLLAEWDDMPLGVRRDSLRQILTRVRVWGGQPVRVKPVPPWEDEREPITSPEPAGEDVPRRRNLPAFTPEQAQEIRAKHAAGQSQMSLSREYGVSSSTIYYLVRGRSYRTVSS